MINPLQSRTLAVSGAALPTFNGAPVFTPVRLAGHDKLGELFEYTLVLKTPDTLAFSPSIAANVDLEKLIGTEVTVSIELEGKGRFIPGMKGDAGMGNVGAGIREVTGLVTSARLVREEGRSIVYELTLRPWLWLATKNQDCRIFQNMDVDEISDEVLSKYPFPVEKRLFRPAPRRPFPKREIQRQHWESDWTFLQRLWEEFGIYYWFECSDGHHRLVLADAMAAHRPHDSEAYRTLRYEAPGGKRLDEEHIHALSVENRLTTGSVSGVDYDYTQPRADLTTRYEDPRDTAHGRQDFYTWGDYAQPQAGAAGLTGERNAAREEAEYLAKVRLQAFRCTGLRATGQGHLRGLTTGQTFVLTHYPQMAANREYVVVASSLVIEEIAQESGTGQRYRCTTDFEIQPSNETFRLMQTIPKPRTSGPERAVVVGPEGQEIWTDQYGRVKIQFVWDKLGKRDQNASCWVRVSSPWQGNQWGAIYVPRIGTEVIVDHIHGDPDLPIARGTGVNAQNQPPWSLPGNEALAGMRGHGLKNSGETAQFVIDDTSGESQAQMSSDHGTSSLSVGFIRRIFGNKGRQDARGKGFELRTDLWGVLRAARGLLITTEARPAAQSHAKDMGETVARLESAHRLHDDLTQIAQQSEAQDADGHQSDLVRTIDAQNQQIRGTGATDDNPSPELADSHLLMAGKAGVEVVTPETVHVAAQQVAMTTDGHVGIASGRSFFVSVRDTVRMFAQRAGMPPARAPSLRRSRRLWCLWNLRAEAPRR